MSSYDDREKGQERKFVHDEELTFKANARRNKLVGLWAAGKLGKQGADAEQYAKDVVMADFESGGVSDVVEKLLKDFTTAGIPISARDIHIEMERQLPIARQQILDSRK